MADLIIVGNTTIVFLALLIIIYLFDVRRRARIHMLVDHLEAIARKGLPLQDALRVLGTDLGGVLGARLGRVARMVEDGATLGEAFSSCPHVLPPVLRKMVDLGDRSGNLTAFLGEMRSSYRRIETFPHRSAAILIYPVVVSFVIGVGLMFLYVYIVPKFKDIFTSLQMGLDILDWWPWIRAANLVVLLLAVLFAVFVFIGESPLHFGISPLRFVKRLADRVLLRLPVLGNLLRCSSLESFAVSTGHLLRAGAALPEAVRTAGGAERNGVLRARYERMADHLDEGGAFAEYCRGERWLPGDFVWFVEGGEASGAMPDLLLQAASHFDTKVRYVAQIASRAIVPFFVILNGALVLAVWVGTWFPIVRLHERVTPPW
jgi:type II secretory pathway component PulF